jgi:hypothetical protein
MNTESTTNTAATTSADTTTNAEEHYRPTEHAHAHDVSGLPAVIRASVIIVDMVWKVQLSD